MRASVHRLGLLICLWLCTGLCARAADSEPQRVALVIGNGAYAQAALPNPVNDATAMAQALREAGFSVQLQLDADHRTTLTALREFGDRLRRARMGVFYFAGHGVQIKGRNYLIPVGADIQREDEVAYAALDAQAVLDKMETAGNPVNLLILDACRNNPFARNFRSAVPGLAQMEAPPGTLVAFATAPGSVSSDGRGRHGLYTGHLLEAMRQPGAKVEEVFKRVRVAVRRDSAGKQIPWESTSLEGEVSFFARGPRPAPPSRPVSATSAPAADPTVELAAAQAARTAELLAQLSRPAPPASATAAGQPAKPAPARNTYGYTVGDRWNYQQINRQRGEVVSNWTVRVARLQADGSWLSHTGNLFDAEGRPVRWVSAPGERRTVLPHAPRWWAGMKVGDARHFSFESIGETASGIRWKQAMETDARVIAVESVRVPAGEFKAWRIEHQGSLRNVGSYGAGTFTQTLWYVPELHTWVAHEYRSTWNGSPAATFREELTSYALAAPAPR